MYEELLRTRLNNLYEDLTCSSEEAVTLVSFMSNAMEDKSTIIRDMYYHDYAPVRVLNPAHTIKGGVQDIEAEIIAVSEGYDNFIKKINNRTSNVLNRHATALALFLNILALPEPYNRLLYMRFFKGLKIDDLSREMFCSKSSCYRKIERGIYILNKLMNAKEEESF